jgi:hypothetical protein
MGFPATLSDDAQGNLSAGKADAPAALVSSDLAERHERAAERHRTMASHCDQWKVADAHLAAAAFHFSQAEAIRRRDMTAGLPGHGPSQV